MKKIKKNLSTGLTLIETLVAITILVVGVLGPLNIASRGIGDGIFAANQLAANYLAQEALEVIINKRYATIRKAQYTTIPDWTIDAGLSTCMSSGNHCGVNSLTAALTADCGSLTGPSNNSCALVFNITNGIYQSPTTLPVENRGTVFNRSVKISAVDAASPPNEIKVTVTVKWNNKNVPRTLTIVEHLFSKG
ncbi:hypothetical protein IT398_01960 [Candidatus Nomurabacteria bacterium]|nr:hypothetical protein [Candidatus Nomurabacteria bacterium]